MRLLFVHERFGNFAGAEVNAWLTADELKRRGHTVGLLHGAPTGKGERDWREVFGECFPIAAENPSATTHAAVDAFAPDAVYVHKMADAAVLSALLDSARPLVR